LQKKKQTSKTRSPKIGGGPERKITAKKKKGKVSEKNAELASRKNRKIK